MENRKKLVKSIFGINLTVMRLLGFYSPRKCKHLYKLYSFTVYCMFTSLVPILSSLYLIMAPHVDLDKVADNAFVICQLGCFTIKVLPFVFNGEEIRKSIYMMEHPIFLVFTKKQETIIENCRTTCRRTSLLFLVFCIMCVITWGSAPFFESDYKFPIDIWVPYDFTKNSKLYFMTFFYVLAGAGNSAITDGALDPLVAGMTYFATCQIKILKDNLQHLGEKSEAGLIYEQIMHCVSHHNIIIEFVKTIEKIYSSVAFTQFCASVVVICICCFKLSQVSPFSMNFVWMTTFLCTMLAEIFLFCVYGTTLYEENNTLIQAVYMGKWYEYDLKSQRALIILMERSRRPMIVTAGKILDLSLETFTTILRRAYSLLAVLKNY
ncbi:hypothetical protein Zmor_015672 [Zophobas morio]|uniref:Odorant receptor n=1 Tax=Zophobas morio TaxID=2755281 RepID=A0AA38IMJ5_9CUCU|nr:hypothetical protein Zmor_015672 [Zophobas morio]